MAHILVVDDDMAVLSLVARILKIEGHVVSTASDGRQALDVLKHRVPDLILSDIRMPDLDGETLLREVKARAPQVPCIAVSGELDKRDTAGFDAFVQKPFCVQHLIETVARALGSLARSA